MKNLSLSLTLVPSYIINEGTPRSLSFYNFADDYNGECFGACTVYKKKRVKWIVRKKAMKDVQKYFGSG